VSQQATAQQDVHGEDFRLDKLRPSAETFGAVIDFLARVKPFNGTARGC